MSDFSIDDMKPEYGFMDRSGFWCDWGSTPLVYNDDLTHSIPENDVVLVVSNRGEILLNRLEVA